MDTINIATQEPKRKRRNGETVPVQMEQYDCTLIARKSPPFKQVVAFQRASREAADEESAIRVLQLYIKGWDLKDEAGNPVQFTAEALADCDSDFVTDAYGSLDKAGLFPSPSTSEEKSLSSSEDSQAQNLQTTT